MNIPDAHQVSALINSISFEKERHQKLYSLQGQIKEILAGYYEIPEEEIFKLFQQIEKLSGYVDKRIEKIYNQIKEL